MKHIVIIGNGISGVTAARHIRKLSDHQITVVSSETPYFFSRTALMYVYMGHMKFENIKPYEDWFWKKNRIDLWFDHAEKVETGIKAVRLRSGKVIHYDDLVIATGSQSNFFDWPGQHLNGVQALYSYPDLQKLEENTRGIKKAVIIGGGLIGVELAEMLRSRNIQVTFLIRERAFWNNVLPLQEATMISRHITSHHVDLRHQQNLKEILPDGNGKVTSVVTEEGQHISCDFVAIAVGVHPNISLLRNSEISVNEGILVNEFLETNVPHVYAIGDCVERQYALEGRKNIEQVWYTGRMMGEVIAQTLCGVKTKYEPGPWFNSAKFFDIEFQNYGNVGSTLQENEDELYWEHPDRRKAIHLVWNKETKQLIGVNSFGIRLRHERFDRWLRDKRDIGFVIDHLPEANFDPEFTERHESEIQHSFNIITQSTLERTR